MGLGVRLIRGFAYGLINTAIAFVSSSVSTSGSISVLAAASSSNISGINQTKTIDHMLV